MYLSRYTISKPLVVVEIEPATGEVRRQFTQPEDWQWDPERPHAHWDEYRGHRFFVYIHDGKLVFQANAQRFVLDPTYSSTIDRVLAFWKRFSLYRNGELAYRFTYLDPHARPWSLLSAAANMDEWWDWDTPFDSVHSRLRAEKRTV